MCRGPARYLVFFQYFGTRYSGVMETKSDQALVGVQNYLERAAQQLRPSAPVRFHISSRTDAGVHALANAAHVDIERSAGKAPFTGRELLQGLNHHLKPEPIRILSAQRVPSSFHARFSALSRTYIYRLLLGCAHHAQVPVFERDLCWAPPGRALDTAAMAEAAALLLGTHDFSTFRSLHAHGPAPSPVRTLLRAELRPSTGLLCQHYLPSGLEFWEVKFESRAFLYRQVRRMVGALVAVGQGRLSPQRVAELLRLRDPRALPGHAMAPARGLFLQRVRYSPADLTWPCTGAAPQAELEELCGVGLGQGTRPGPDQIPINPDRIPINPDQIPINPDRIQINPDQIPINPDQIPINPDQIPINPDRIQINPDQTPINPDRIPINPDQTPIKSQ